MRFPFEQGPIRPPSEARSLLVRVTRNCPWNKCAFCYSYHGTKFELRSVADIKQDIQMAANIAEEIKALSWKMGEGGNVTDSIVHIIYGNDHIYDDGYRSIAAWLYFGGKSVFLQDANTIIMKTDELVEIVSFIKEKFPFVERITSYCRSKTACRKPVEDFRKLYEAGLSRIHVGLESGSDKVLQLIAKGVTAAEHIEGGQRIVASGIALSEYVMPGLGGREWSDEHARQTAAVINQINPRFVRLRSLQVRRGTKLHDMMKNGEFEPLGDEGVVREIRTFIGNLEGIQSNIVSDHILNLLEELEGKLPEDKERLLAIIDRYFALPEDERAIYRLGRRKGFYRRLDDLADLRTHEMLQKIVDQYKRGDYNKLDKDLYRAMHHYI